MVVADAASRLACGALLVGAAMLWPHPAAAQGPLTEGFGEVDPTTFAFRLGPLLATPGLTVREIGIDTNIFDDPEDPKRDFVAAIAPDLQLFMRTGALRVVTLSGADFVYYRDFADQRYTARQARVRADLLLGRLRPFAFGAFVQSRDRLGPEVERRTRRQGVEYGAGVGFELSATARVFAAAARTETAFGEGEAYRGVDLAAAFDRTTESRRVGLQMALTPFTTLQVAAGTERETFVVSPSRDSTSRTATLQLAFAPDAVVRGRARVGYREFQPADAALVPYRGVTAQVGVDWTMLSTARLAVDLDRDVSYSFEETEGYFVQSSVVLGYTQRVLGPWDVQVRGGRRWLEYGRSTRAAARTDRAALYLFGLGYNLADRSRVSVSYEYTDRTAPARPDRRFARRRIFGAWTYQF